MGGVARVEGIAVGSPRQMLALGECLGHLLQVGDFIGLVGELGAGKTLLVRGVARGAGVPESQVASPTFAIVYPYRGRLPIHHADFFRLSGLDELYTTGFFDLLAQGASIVEWIDRVPEVLPAESLILRIERTGERTRRVKLEARGMRHRTLGTALEKAFLGKPRT